MLNSHSPQSQSAVSINTQNGRLSLVEVQDKHLRNLFKILHNLVTEELKYPLAYFLYSITVCICVFIRLSFHVLSGVCSPAYPGHSEVVVTHEKIVCHTSDQGHTKGYERYTVTLWWWAYQTNPVLRSFMRCLSCSLVFAFFTDLFSLRFEVSR